MMTTYKNAGWYRSDAYLEVEMGRESTAANTFVPVIELTTYNDPECFGDETAIAIITLGKEDARKLAAELLQFADTP